MARWITRREAIRRAAAAAAAACFSTRLSRAADRPSEVPWLDEIQTAPSRIPTGVPRLRPLLRDDTGAPIVTLEAWHRRREQIRQAWLDFLKPLPIDRKSPPQFKIISEDRIDRIARQLIRYDVEPDWPVEAFILRPQRQGGSGVLLLHSTVKGSIHYVAGPESGRGDAGLGLLLAKRGHTVLCPRNFLWPDSRTIAGDAQTRKFQQRHPASKGMAKMLFDSVRALDILAALDGVDPARLGAAGHSLGAKEVLYLAAFDERIRAAVFSEGGIGIGYSNWEAPWYLSDAVKSHTFTHEHHELLALIAPRAMLLLGGDDADGAKSWPFISAALPVYKLHPGRPRLGLFNHGQGHALPSPALDHLLAWFAAYL